MVYKYIGLLALYRSIRSIYVKFVTHINLHQCLENISSSRRRPPAHMQWEAYALILHNEPRARPSNQRREQIILLHERCHSLRGNHILVVDVRPTFVVAEAKEYRWKVLCLEPTRVELLACQYPTMYNEQRTSEGVELGRRISEIVPLR